MFRKMAEKIVFLPLRVTLGGNAFRIFLAVVDILHPQMQEGRWFIKKDREADVLHAVIKGVEPEGNDDRDHYA